MIEIYHISHNFQRTCPIFFSPFRSSLKWGCRRTKLIDRFPKKKVWFLGKVLIYLIYCIDWTWVLSSRTIFFMTSNVFFMTFTYSSRDPNKCCNGIYSMLVMSAGLCKLTSSIVEYPIDDDTYVLHAWECGITYKCQSSFVVLRCLHTLIDLI